MNLPSISRRQFLTTTVASAGALMLRPALGERSATEFSFLLLGDTHYCASLEQPDRLDSVSAQYTSRLVETLNQLPGLAITPEAGGGGVIAPRGIVHAGDCIHFGDRAGDLFPAMQRTELAAFRADFGLTGADARLKYPVYEVFGNHDAPNGEWAVLEHFAARTRERRDLTRVSENALHYSWDWGPIHFINLGINVASVRAIERPRRFDAFGSLDFLIADLAANVGDSSRAVIITHHVDLGRTFTCDPSAPFSNLTWDPCDLRAYWEAIRETNVVAMLYGHTHKRATFRWDGATITAPRGVPVFNTASAAHFNLKQHGFFYFEVREHELIARELQTADGWLTATWSPQVWRVPLQPRSG